jgi:hypothetical protein
MGPTSRHQCLIYDGPPSRHLPRVASAIQDKLKQRHRCLYLNSPPMVAGIKSYLAASGVDVARETEEGSLVLSSDREHLVDDSSFDLHRMIETLHYSLRLALADGYEGLWATGDMTWEFGPAKNLATLLEYEWRLEEFMREHPQMGGICQYHVETLPRDVVCQGLLAHAHLFVNETLTMINPHYLQAEFYSPSALANPKLDAALDRLLAQDSPS